MTSATPIRFGEEPELERFVVTNHAEWSRVPKPLLATLAAHRRRPRATGHSVALVSLTLVAAWTLSAVCLA